MLVVAQAGRLQYEAVILAASLAGTSPRAAGRLFIAEPQPGPLWPDDPRITDPAVRDLLEGFGARFLPFENRLFGAAYPHGNKIEALAALPPGEPFVFFDTDTLFLSDLDAVPFDFDRPSASMRRTDTWPEPPLYGPDRADIWKSLYDRHGLDFASSQDASYPEGHWERYLYFNAGWFFYRCPQEFGARFAEWSAWLRDNQPPELACQSLDPWLDQVVLPLVIHSFGGGRPGPELAGLDGAVSCHWRNLPLLYAREDAAAVAMLERIAGHKPIRRVLRDHPPVRKLVYQNRGAKIRAMFERDNLPPERGIRNRLREAGLWMR